jgi:8-oxo-dGTP pyrophosphatase MutT (NUDIX family)
VAWKRLAARAVVLDPEGRIFLQESKDPADPSKGTWWELPGGGIDPGETSAEAVTRELYEECGFAEVEVGDVLWDQRVQFTFARIDFDQSEQIHVARLPRAEAWDPQHLEAIEALAFVTARWWTIDELLASDVKTAPGDLRERLIEVRAALTA